ncbi:MAG: hypothetical protein R2761_22335 [Acidimicrobiales bacterium]
MTDDEINAIVEQVTAAIEAGSPTGRGRAETEWDLVEMYFGSD